MKHTYQQRQITSVYPVLAQNFNVTGHRMVFLFWMILVSSCFLAPACVFAAPRYAVVNGNWNSTGTWAESSNGAPGASIPIAGDIVFIGESSTSLTVLIPSGYTAACSGLTMGNMSNGTAATLNFSSGTSSLTISGNLIMNRPTANVTSLISIGAGNLTVTGNVEMSNHIVSSGAGARKNKIAITTGNLTVGGNLVFNAEHASQSVIEFTDAGTLNLEGYFTIQNGLGTLDPGTSTTTFNGMSGAQVIPISVSNVIYYNLNVSNTHSNGATISAAIYASGVKGNLSVLEGTLHNGGFVITLAINKNFSVANSATFNLTGTSSMVTVYGTGTKTFGPVSTTRYSGASQTVAVQNYGHLALSSTAAGNKTFAGATTIAGNLSVSGSAVALLANGSTSSSQTLTLGGINQPTGSWGGTLSAATYQSATWFGISTTGILNVNISCIPDTWLGAFSTDWNDSGNWCGGVPTITTDVLIPSGPSNQPVIGSMGASARNITINALATLTISGPSTFTISGNWVNGGTFIPGTSTVNFNRASGTQTIDNGTSVFNKLTHSGSGTLQLLTNNITLNSDLTNSAGTIDANNLSISLKGNWSNNASFIAGAGTVNFNGSTLQTILGTTTTSFNNLTINNAGGVAGASNMTVNAVLHLQSNNPTTSSGSLAMGTNTLMMGGGAINTGIGDVSGITKRIGFIPGTEYTFGNQFTSIIFQNIGTLPTEVSIKLTIGAAPAWKTSSIQRIYAIIQSGAVNNIANIKSHYLDTELNGNVENNLVFWRCLFPFTVDTGVEFGRSNGDYTNNWISISSFPFYLLPSSFGYWEGTMAASNLTSATWNGSVNTTWIEPLNWTPNGVPSDISAVIIPDAATTPNDPTTIYDTTTIKSVTIHSGGILNASVSSTIVLKGGNGAWSNLGGVFNHNSGKVIFTNTGSTIAGVTDFYNITINPGARLTIESNSIMRIAGTITNSGTWTAGLNENTTVEYNGGNQFVVNPNGSPMGYHNLIFSGSGMKTMPGSALSIHGNFTMSGTSSTNANAGIVIGGSFVLGAGTAFAAGVFSHSIGGNFSNNGATFTSTGSTITFNGITTQTIGGSSSSTFNNFTITNLSGALLTINETVSGILTLSSGKISTGVNSLIIGNSSPTAIMGASYLSYINGNLRRSILSGANIYPFPVGTATVYSPASIAFTAGTIAGILTGSTTDGDHPNFTSTTFAPLSSVNRYWQFEINTGLSTANYGATYHWVSADQDPAFDFSTALVGKFNNPSTWIYPMVATSTATSIEIAGVTGFSDFQVANGCSEYTASISADNFICSGSSGNLVVSLSGGAGPYTIVYTGDGGGTITNYISGSNIPVSPSVTTTYTLTSVTDATGCIGTITGNPSVTITVNPSGTWLGTTSTDWNTASNWCGGIPSLTTDVIITAGPLHQPIIGVAGGLAHHLTIESGASLTITGSNSLTVSGAWIKTGTFFAGSSTVNFDGTGAANIGTSNFNNITFSGSGAKTATGILTIAGNVSISNNFTAGSFTHTVGHDWTNTGIFIATGSTIDFNSPSNGNIGTSNFNNITFSGTGIKAATGALMITGNLVLNHNFTGHNSILTLLGNWTTNGIFTAGGGTIFFNGASVQQIRGTSITTFTNLTINNTSGVNADINAGVNGILNLQSANPSTSAGSLAMGDNTLTMGPSSTTVGAGDVTGIINRSSFIAGTTYTFGNQFTTIAFQSVGTIPTSVSLKITLGTSPTWKTSAIHRIYALIQTGASNSLASLSAHYLDSELNGNIENTLVFWRCIAPFTPGSGVELGRSNFDLMNNSVSVSSLPIHLLPSNFGYWEGSIASSELPNATWNGSVNTVWIEALNWTPNGVPSDLSDVIIPDASTTPHDPITNFDTTVIKSLTLQSGSILNAATSSSLTLNGGSGAWSNNGGTFNADSSIVIFTNALATYSGTTDFHNVKINSAASLIMQTESMMRISGTITNDGVWRVALNQNNTVEYNGANQTVINPNGVVPGYHHLILSGSGFKTMPFTAMEIHGDFSMSGSAVTSAGGALTITDDFTIGSGTTFNTAILAHSIGGDFLNNGGIFNASGSTITLNGTNPQTIGGSTSTTFNNLTLNNTSGVVLDINENIAGTLNFINGIISTGTNTLNINNAGTAAVLGASSTNYVNGFLNRDIANGANTYSYAIGTDTVYAPAIIAFDAGTTSGQLTGYTIDGDHPQIGSSTLAVTSSVNRHWVFDVSQGLTTSNYNATYQWVASDEDPPFDFTTADVGKFDNASTWTYPAVGPRTANTIEIMGMSDFSDFQVANGCSAFSASLSGPSSVCTGSEVNLIVTITGGISPYTVTYSGGGGGTITNYISGTDIPVTLSENTTYTLISVTDAGGCIGTIGDSSMVTIILHPDGTWLGTTSTDWNTSSNWCGGVPTATTDVLIWPGGNQPVIGTAGGVSRDLSIFSGATLTIADINTLTVYGNWIRLGTFVPNNSTVIFDGTVTRNIAATNFNHVTFISSGTSTAAGNLNIAGNVTILNNFHAGSYTHSVGGNWTNNGSFLSDGSTIIFNGVTAQILSGTSESIFNNLDLNNPGGIIAESNLTVVGLLHLQSVNPSATSGTLALGVNTLTMGGSATTIGIGDVIGITKRNSFLPGIEYTFGNQYTAVTFQNNGTLPDEFSFRTTIGTAPAWKPDGILRIYEPIQSGAIKNTATIQLHYLDSELNGNPEQELVYWYYVIPFAPAPAIELGKTSYNLTNNWVAISSIPVSDLAPAFGVVEATLGSTDLANYTWNGSVDSVWIKPENWTPYGVPSTMDDVIIPDAATTPNDPFLPVDAWSIGRITIESGGIVNATPTSVLTIDGGAGAWTNIGGSFNANTGMVIFINPSATITGETNFYNLTISAGGALTMESDATTRIAGTMTNEGIWQADFNENIIEYNGADQTILNPNGSSTGYHHLILSGTGIKAMPGTLLEVNGDFTMTGTASATAGAAMTFGGDFTLESGTAFNTGAFNHSIAGDFTNNNASFITTGSTITLNGTMVQILGGSIASTFNNLIINSAGITLENIVTVNGTLTLITGIVDARLYNLIVSNNQPGSVVGGSSITYIKGNLQRTIATGANTYHFPVGSNPYTPVVLEFTSGTAPGSLVVSTTPGDHPAIAGSDLNENQSVNRFWSLTADTGFDPVIYNATFNWGVGDVDPDFNWTNSEVGKYSGNVWIYPTAGTRTETSTQITNQTSFSDFQVANSCTDYTASISAENSICAGTNGNLIVSLSGGVGPYTIVYTGDGGGTITNYINGSNIPVSPSETTTYTLTSVTDARGCIGTITGNPSVTITVNPSGTWLGTTNTDWNTASNWCGGIPTITTDVIITSGALHQPVITVAGCLAHQLTIETGASLTITSSGVLTVSGD